MPGEEITIIEFDRGLICDSTFTEWVRNVLSGRVIEKKAGLIMVKKRTGQDVTRWKFFGVFPTRWQGPNLDATKRA